MKNKGITLIALIITIIIMLILVGVTVNVALNGGLFSTTKKAKEKTEHAVIVENMTSIAMAERASNLDYTATEMRIALKEKGIIKEDGITINTEQFIGRQDDNYIISADGTIRYFGEEIGSVELGLNTIEFNTKMPDYNFTNEDSKKLVGIDRIIKVVEGTIEYRANSKEEYVITAPSMREDEKKFSHWEDDYGNIVSYSPTQIFNILSNTTYTPIYVSQNEAIEKRDLVSLTMVSNEIENLISIELSRNLVNASSISEAGLILTYTRNLATKDNMVLEKAGTNKDDDIRKVAAMTNISGNVKKTHISMNISSIKPRYFRGYIKYVNKQGEECEIYSNIINSSAENQKISEVKAISNAEQVEYDIY